MSKKIKCISAGLNLLIIFLISLTSIILQSCSEKEEAAGGPPQGRKLRIVCTTGMIADAAKNIAGEHAEVKAIMGPGVDPHLYKATQGDLKMLNDADIIFYNGLHLEGKMAEVLEKLGTRKRTVAVADGIAKDRLISNDAFAGAYDPHVWFDVDLWSNSVRYMAQQLAGYDTSHSKDYMAAAEGYQEELQVMHAWVKQQISYIPKERRVLITAHDAFSYFGRAYDIDVRGLQGISTVSEFGLQDITRLVNFISENKIKAVFVESSVPRKSLETVVEGCRQKGHDVKIGGTLYSDAMGAEGTPEGAYLGMVRANVNTIVDGLR